MDGARIANAAAALGLPLRAFTRDAGVDILSFGATKNGAMGAEAVVVFDPALAGEMLFLRKQSMQLASKMRYLAAQFLALAENDLWLENARHANAMAQRLAAASADDRRRRDHPAGARRAPSSPSCRAPSPSACSRRSTSTSGTIRRTRCAG